MGKQSAAASSPCHFPQSPVLCRAIPSSPRVTRKPLLLHPPSQLGLVPHGTCLPKVEQAVEELSSSPWGAHQDNAGHSWGERDGRRRMSLTLHAGSLAAHGQGPLQGPL